MKGTTIYTISMAILTALAASLSGCASMRSFFAVDPPTTRQAPISNPFAGFFDPAESRSQNIVLRTKKGDRAVEIELPAAQGEISDFQIPMSPAFAKATGQSYRGPASVGGASYVGPASDPSLDAEFKAPPPGIADREITSTFPSGLPEDKAKRDQVESELGVMPEEDSVPESDTSYLAAMDHVKRLYKAARYEAALLETDGLLKQYPTDPKLYEMRGTLFDRIGKPELALQSWNQALRFNPSNQSLRNFIEHKQQKRRIASQ